MKSIFTLIIVGLGALLLASAGKITGYISLYLHAIPFVNQMFNYQLIALLTGGLVVILILVLNSESKKMLRIGNFDVRAAKEKWLMIDGKTTWRVNALQLMLFVSIPTALFMFSGVYFSGCTGNFQWKYMPYVVLFAFSNALAEELIFRFGMAGGMHTVNSKRTILIGSAVLFGLPHFYGFPGGIVGVIMSGVLGYILCKATLETKGLLVAWLIHFVQDVIIFTALMMMNVR